MGISKVSNRVLNRIYKILAILLVTFAVLISALRLLLPYAHNYRLDFQNYINKTYHSEIVIGTLHMDWQKSGPAFVARNVSFLQAEGVEVYIGEIDFNLDFWRSIANQQVVTKDLTLNGVKILFDKALLQSSDSSEQSYEILNNIADIFLQQISRFSLVNSQVIYRNEHAQHTYLIETLSWLNQGSRHNANGSVIIDGLTSNNINIALAVEGEAIQDMTGVLYAKANQVNITPWLDKVLAIGDEDTHASINFDAWMSIEQGAINRLQVELGENQIAWQHQGKIQTFNIMPSQVLVSNINGKDNFNLQTSTISVSSNNQQWQPLSIAVSSDKGQLEGVISALNISGSALLTPLFAENEQIRQWIAHLAPQGTLLDVQWQSKNGVLSALATVEGFGNQYYQGIPKMEGVDGKLSFHDQHLNLTVASYDSALDFQDQFDQPMEYNELAIHLDMFFKEQGVTAQLNRLFLVNEDLVLNGQAQIDVTEGKPTTMALLADVKNANASQAMHYYPVHLMGGDLVNYLSDSLVDGQVSQAQVLFNGPLQEFPFTDHQGIFTVNAELENATFQFDPSWPEIENFYGNLNFTNNSMLITGRSGTLKGINVTGVTAVIEELVGEQLLAIDAKVLDAKPSDIKVLMAQSPLDDSVGAVLEQVSIGKPVDADITLSIPLNDTDKTSVAGKVYFDNNAITLQSPEMHFEQVSGVLSFVDEVIKSKNLTTDWRGMPLSIAVDSAPSESTYQTRLSIEAPWQESQWQAQLPESLTAYAQGQVDWRAELILNNDNDGKFSYELSVLSDLARTQLNLPKPFNKAIDDKRSVYAKVTGDEHESTLDAVVGENISFYGVLDHQKTVFKRAHLVLGQEDMLLPLNGFHISAALDSADISEWQPLISDILTSIEEHVPDNAASLSLMPAPQRVRGKVAQLNVLGETIDDVIFNLSDEQAWWALDLSSVQAQGQIKFYPDWLTQGIAIDADFINIPAKLTESESSVVEADDEKQQLAIADNVFNALPPITAQCRRCTLWGLDLGELNFSISRREQGSITVDSFIAKRDKSQVILSGQWQKAEQGYDSQFKGRIELDDIEQELKKLGYASLIKDSGLESNFELNWEGAPFQWNLETLDGEISSELDDGYLADVDDKGLRIFSVLSLQSLVRKLTLDFRDIFSDGMFYSQIKSHARLEDGVLYTDNTKMKGAAGDLSIQGNTNLVSETLDYRMSYKPNFSASLPAIAWIATLNPVTFLGALALDEVLISKVWSEFTFELTGNINEPSLREVNRKSQNISVGRSSPPQIVDTDVKASDNTEKTSEPETEIEVPKEL
ncbi:YhdP family protein [Thalassotalea ganghwensis]